jgi:hypothetical protein
MIEGLIIWWLICIYILLLRVNLKVDKLHKNELEYTREHLEKAIKHGRDSKSRDDGSLPYVTQEEFIKSLK